MTQTPQQGGQQPQTQLTSQNATALKRMQEETTQQIMERVTGWQETGEVVLPKGYHVGNAIKLAWLYLQTVENLQHQKAIDYCTKDSICNALLNMVINGEYPQKHCYFIMYGNRLEWQERYLGKLMRARRDTEIGKVNAQVIYEGDEFVYTIDENGEKQLVKHVPNLANIDNTKILAAYAVVINKDGTRHIEVMTRTQIQKAWEQGAMKGKSGAHTNFTDQMCMKTVIQRACKIALDSTADPGDDDDPNHYDEATAEREAAQGRQAIDAEAVEVKDEQVATPAPKGLEANASYIDMSNTQQPAAEPAPAANANAGTGASRACPLP
ncbi:recombinase RecT [Prevotella copri]|uniref:Recombinase RecT n=1 Tax=Segatella copri TaxID=165179 RepID=A0AA90UD32_9BACT|nr:RecT family recombinase [Segatella copri]MQN11366.1 recombinase RecT [Segatella copri]MQN15361.1 recombinase RecT [Segatella copri]MQN19573.1 recombinase RecT [Segatella copri]